MKDRIKEWGRRLLDPVAGLLLALKVTPNQVTVTGLLLSLASGAALAMGRFRTGMLLLLAGSLCDVLDGSLARRSGRATRFGAFLDSTMDRYAETGLFLGLAVYYAGRSSVLDVGVTFAAAAGSLLVSYARARAEGLGLECRVGWLERPERMAILILAAAVGQEAMSPALWVLAAGTHATALQRVRHVQLSLARRAE